jgi:predicted nucleic acid-binding protein
VRFWDSSAVVPLAVRQAASRHADAWIAQDRDVVVWTLTAVEVASALRRLVRDGVVAERAAAHAETFVDELVARCHAVTDVERVKGLARRALRLHALRSADALQLGAALIAFGRRPRRRGFVALDDRLLGAAAGEGFDAIRPGE